MKELMEYRKSMLDRFETMAHEFHAVCLSVKDPFAPIDDGWNVHQLAAHTRDVDKLVYGLRVLRTMEEDNPLFESFDGDAYMREKYNSKESLRGMLDGFLQSVESLIGRLREAPIDAWSRESRHETMGGGITMQTWVERGLAHIEEHLASVKKAK